MAETGWEEAAGLLYFHAEREEEDSIQLPLNQGDALASCREHSLMLQGAQLSPARSAPLRYKERSLTL